MHSYCINKLLNIKGVYLKKVEHLDSSVKFYLETKPSEQICPACGAVTKRIHDYRMQTIKDVPFQFKHCFLVLKKRRYVCKCGKRFYEHYDFLPRYYQRTNRLSAYIVHSLHNSCSIKSVATSANLSQTTVSRVLDTLSWVRPKLSSALSIDEFRGNADTGKYQCILIDPVNHKVLDILPDRKYEHLAAYFHEIPRDERYRLKFFVCDMWKPYIELAKIYFPNAQIIIDKYHFVRQTSWAIENVRKRLQRSMPAKLRKYYKRSRSLILAHYSMLKDEKKKQCDLMLLYSEDLRLAHRLKEDFYALCKSPKYSEQRTAFFQWIKYAESSGIPEFEKCANTSLTWSKEILNALKYRNISNGPTEGYNNKIKVQKRVSYGIRNFKRFRIRILLITKNN